MKVNPSFTGSVFAELTPEHKALYPTEVSTKIAMRKSGVNFHKISEYEIKNDFVALVTSDQKAEAKAIDYFKANNLTPIVDPEIKKIGLFIRETAAKLGKTLV